MTNLNTHGYHFWERGMPIATVIILNYDPDLKMEGMMSYESLNHPTSQELKVACEQNGLPFEKIEEIVYSGNHDTHTLMIDVKKFLEGNK